MLNGPTQVYRVIPLQPLPSPGLSRTINVLSARYLRLVPAHYLTNPLTREIIDINILLVKNGSLVTPTLPETTFQHFYQEMNQSNPDLFQQVLSPSGTAKGVTTRHLTPIKEIAGLKLANFSLPGDESLYGWYAMEQDAAQQKARLEIFFQGNGLYFNRGSVLFDGQNLLAYPDQFLSEFLEGGVPFEVRQRLAVDDYSLKRPLLFFVTGNDGKMWPYHHTFEPDESYLQGMRRLENFLRSKGVRAALAASPPLIIPGEDGLPVYLRLPEILKRYHANDVRHSLYCPYRGSVLLSAELSRAQCLQPDRLSHSLSDNVEDRVYLHLRETLRFITLEELLGLLDEKGYRGRYMHTDANGNGHLMWINPLEGVYSFLVPFLTRSGQFGLLQTSGTHGNITGNDGPTMRQLTAILHDLNTQPPFDDDPIIAAASGSQGNDVPNIVCRSRTGVPGLLHVLAPSTSLDKNSFPRGVVTTPRVGIATLN